MLRPQYEPTEMSGRFVITIFSLIVDVLKFSHGARILALCPSASISHQVVFRGLTVALNKQGHELVVVTTDPLNDSNLINYTEIDISFMYKEIVDINYINIRGTQRLYEFLLEIAPILHNQAEEILNHPEVRKLYALNSNEKFDLVLIEMFASPALLPLGKRFDAPIVGVASLGLTLYIQYGIGNPIFPSHPSHWDIRTKGFKKFLPWQRLDNFVKAWRNIHYFESDYLPKQEAISKKYFGNDIPSLRELQRNISLIFVNQQLPISFARPNLPNIIEIDSFHLSKQAEHLPQDLQKTLDGATQGFVYMSLGSNVKSSMLSAELLGEFIAAFSKLPYKVIWKFENDTLPDKPVNVITMKWTPQKAILAHPNLKVFIYQGGIQSTEEAIHHAVPLIGLPVVSDQDSQVDMMVTLGVAKKLEITTIDRNDLLVAINTVVTDASYKQRMLNLRSLIKDRPHDLLKNAIWWTEYVIRHRGAPSLRSSFADEPWYQRGDMDIIAFLSATFLAVFSSTLIILYKFLKKFICVSTAWLSRKKTKVN